MQPDNVRGILVMLLGMFLFSAADALAKLLTQTLHPVQIVWTRQSGLLIAILVLLALRGPGMLRTLRPGFQMARGALAVGSAVSFVLAVRYLPLADAVAVGFVAPFFVTILAAFLLGEPVGPRRWIAVLIGFAGTLIVIRPGAGVMHPAVALVFLAALLFALRQILSRRLARTDRVITTVAYTALTSSAILTIPLPFFWHTPETAQEIWLLLALAVLAAIAEVCVIKALELGQAVAIAPIQYSLILWATFYGFVLFGDFPDLWTWVGTAILVGSGLYTIWREIQSKRTRAT